MSLNEKQVLALRKMYEFWLGKKAEAQKAMDAAMEADNPDALNAAAEAAATADVQIAKKVEEAKAGGVDLTATATVAPTPTPTSTEAPAAAAGSPSPKKGSKKEREAKVQERAAQIASEKAAKPSGGKANGSAPKPKKEKKLQPCLDGCGEQVPGNFKMGHDAKLKSMILKVERGEMDMGELPEIAQELVTFKKGEKEPIMQGNKKTGDRQLYVVTKAPVRFQGRPEITLTTRA